MESKVGVFVALVWPLAEDSGGSRGDVHVGEVVLEAIDLLI